MTSTFSLFLALVQGGEDDGIPWGLLVWVVIFFVLPTAGKVISWISGKLSTPGAGNREAQRAPRGAAREARPTSRNMGIESRQESPDAGIEAWQESPSEGMEEWHESRDEGMEDWHESRDEGMEDWHELSVGGEEEAAAALPPPLPRVVPAPAPAPRATPARASVLGDGALPSATRDERVPLAPSLGALSSPLSKLGDTLGESGHLSTLESPGSLGAGRPRGLRSGGVASPSAAGLVPRAGRTDWRRAIVLSEVLASPVALRDPGGPGSPPGLH